MNSRTQEKRYYLPFSAITTILSPNVGNRRAKNLLKKIRGCWYSGTIGLRRKKGNITTVELIFSMAKW
jgi:hypothetical protein